MLWTIFVILVVLWLLGFSFHIGGGLIRINTLCPGHTETPMDQGQPGGLKPGEIERYALPIEQANPTVWLCSDWASYITGVTLPVDGGATASL